MAMGKYCKRCGRVVRAIPRYPVNHVAHLLFSVVTLGLWFPFWLLAGILSVVQGRICNECGKRI